MKAAWLKYLDAQTPRYTSHPPALHFDASVTEDDLAAKCADVALYAPISLYVHAPFCCQLCSFCSCSMRVENLYGRALDYVDALIDEIAMHASALKGRGRLVSVHFGGGTPNYFLGDDIARILSAIEAQLGLTDSVHLSIELDPRILRRRDIDHLTALGFIRFSLGVQDFDPAVQAAINRLQGFDLVEACVSEMREAGVDDLSFDILCGLPQQTSASFSDTINKVIAIDPDRVAIFGYAHLPAVFPRQHIIAVGDLPGAEARAEMASRADRQLTGAGYRRVGFDHYAKPGNDLARASACGRLKRNFEGFCDDSSSAIFGAGASAISVINGLYAQNEKNVGAYVERVSRGKPPVVRGLVRTTREEIVAAAISELLCSLTADVGRILRAAGPAEGLRICAALDRLEADGVIAWEGDRVSMADGAFFLAPTVACALDPYAALMNGMALAV
ncbi:MAG: oxygen-independent coproporphyrinogen III oxidase [Parvularculaceae bacterium]